MPLIIPANTISGEYEVANSLRFDDGSSDNLTRTTDTPDNRDKFTVSAWIKLSSHASKNPIVAFYGSNDYCSLLYNDERIQFIVYDGGNIANISLTSRHRDFSAWYHIVLAVDSTQATASDRVKIYVNGVQETTLTDTSYPAQNADMIRSTMTTTAVGRSVDQLGTNFYCDGYLAEVVCIDNQQLTPTSFGEFDEDSSVWKPINLSGLTFGTNGFYLDFENSGSLGADVSGNGNNFTVNNLTSIDQTTDTPTNNYATINPLDIRISGGTNYAPTISNGNLQVTGVNSGTASICNSTIALNTGKFYAEYKITNSTVIPRIGILSKDLWNGSSFPTFQGNAGYGYRNDGQKETNSTQSAYGASYTTGDIIGVAFDCTNGNLEFYKNGVSQGVAFTGISTNQSWCFMCTPHLGDTIEANFGNPSFTISSGNSDAKGYGNFEYAVPSGYYALNTKNLAEYG